MRKSGGELGPFATTSHEPLYVATLAASDHRATKLHSAQAHNASHCVLQVQTLTTSCKAERADGETTTCGLTPSTLGETGRNWHHHTWRCSNVTNRERCEHVLGEGRGRGRGAERSLHVHTHANHIPGYPLHADGPLMTPCRRSLAPSTEWCGRVSQRPATHRRRRHTPPRRCRRCQLRQLAA